MIIGICDFIDEAKAEIEKCFSSKKPAEIFHHCMTDTLSTTIQTDERGTFILTGDIPAMWLRDSVCQIRPFLMFAKENKDLQELILGLIKRQLHLIKEDPYANAFNQSANGNGHQDDKTEMKPIIWERKYEIDSLCYPLQLAYLFWKTTGRTEHFSRQFIDTVKTIIALWQVEQHHEELSPYRFERETAVQTDTLAREGKGAKTAYTGMLWSGFRPSDDACTYGYLVPSNMFAVVILGYLEEMISAYYDDDKLLKDIAVLKEEIQTGIERFALVDHPDYGKIYAYEVDGLGSVNLMDDANVPSLLALPFLGYCSKEDPIYLNTRRFILSSGNPYFFTGSEANGVGSPHTPHGHIWPIALSIQGLTSSFEAEKRNLLNDLMRTDAGTQMMHESFDADDAAVFTREWFSWANMMFCELVLDASGYRLMDMVAG